jgi:uncharacterized protein with NRDE domain
LNPRILDHFLSTTREKSREYMCLILLALQSHPKYTLILAANRDEFYDRPTAQAGFWGEAPELLAGKDLKAGGTWLGVTRRGRIAAVTNYRDPASNKEDAPSRGKLVTDFLLNPHPPEAYLGQLMSGADRYNGFNILFGEKGGLIWFSNRGEAPRHLAPGIYGVSNRLLDTPWPKIERGKKGLRRWLSETNALNPEALFRLLNDHEIADDQNLPDTGVGLERERMLSPIFITSPIYGTRSSTLLFMDSEDQVTFIERTFHPGRRQTDTVTYTFPMES